LKKHPSIITAAVLLLAIICVAITSKYNSSRFVNEVSIPFQANWVYNWDGEKQQPLACIPANLSDGKKKGQNLYLSTSLPDFKTEGPILLLRTSFQKIKVFIDDEPCYEYGFSKREHMGKTVGSGYHFVKLPFDFAGKKLTVVFNSDYNDNGIINEIRIGSLSGHIIYILKSGFLTFAIPIFLFIISIIMFFLFVPIAYFKQIKPDVIYLAVFNLITSLWFISESRIFQLFNSNQVQNYIFTFMMFYSFMIPLLIFTVKFYKPANKKEMLTVLNIHALFFFAACFLQFGGIMQMYELMHFYWALLMIDVAVFAKAAAKMLKKANLETRVFWFGMIFPVVFGIANMVTMQLRILDNILLIEIGMLMFSITTIVSIIILLLNHSYDKASSDTLYKLAYKDILTGLKNRTAYEEKYQELINKGGQIHGVTVIIADLNNLKKLNDDIGHYAGDIGIKEVADCLSEAFNRLGEIYRYGGDEFIVICEGVSNGLIVEAAEHFHALIRQTNEANSLVKISVALGFAEFDPELDADILDLINRADKEMYKIKTVMKTGVCSLDCTIEE